MPSRQKESLYKDRIFGEDETPPRRALVISSSSSSVSGEKKGAYPFNRDVLASARLNLQHQMWVSSLGYLLHPAIPLNENMLIADVGCGNGIWSMEVAKQLPGSKIEAHDLSLAQTPPKGWAPGNVTFNELDVFKPIPAHLVGRYDIVHLRLFQCVIQSGNPMPLLSALLKLLKPGGYLQWQEYDNSTEKLVIVDTNCSAPKMEALMKGIRGPGTGQTHILAQSWIETFHTRFDEAEAKLVAQARHWTAAEARTMKQEIMFMACREWCANLRAKDLNSPEAAMLETLTKEAEEECWKLHRGAVVDTEMVSWVARKS